MSIASEIAKRRTFAIISHPDAGKTTTTERLLMLGGAIQIAGTVKARKSSRYATSDWMEMEKERGISITSSVMQFDYRKHVINLLDTPGHADFSEDTYRTLTAVDAALMVIDAAKGVEERTIKLMEICRLRDTPIITFINKLDREGREAMDLLDEIERILNIHCVPITWPIGMGQSFRGLVRIEDGLVSRYKPRTERQEFIPAEESGLQSLAEIEDEIELVRGAGHADDQKAFLNGKLTPVFFGSALHNFGVSDVLDAIIDRAPAPQHRSTLTRQVEPDENKFSGFVFKIQANMDPAHRDRVAFVRICSGQYRKGMRLHQVRTGKSMQISSALAFMAGDRSHSGDAYPGDIIGLHNHGTIQIGDTFTEGENLSFLGIPNFAPELFRRVILKEPLRSKALLKGLLELSEEGATQVFRPLNSNDLILGAVGVLQFEVVAWRLRHEYGVECAFEGTSVTHARWIDCDSTEELRRFRQRNESQLALDAGEHLTFLATSRVNLELAMERWPDIRFRAEREILAEVPN